LIIQFARRTNTGHQVLAVEEMGVLSAVSQRLAVFVENEPSLIINVIGLTSA
jgi:hypothetical protein